MAGSQSDITARKVAEEKLQHDALHDDLTGLANRVLFMDRLSCALADFERVPEHQFAVLFFDLDRFKNVNDSLGHPLGDKLLSGIAHRLEHYLRPGDTLSPGSAATSSRSCSTGSTTSPAPSTSPSGSRNCSA